MDPFVLLFLLGWVAASEVTSETVRSGALRTRVLTDDADLVLFYVSEHDGRLGTCGCPSHPRGGLAGAGGRMKIDEGG